MDNVTPPSASPSVCIIKLDQIQYAYYKKSRLEIHSPAGEAITVLCKPWPVITDEDAIYQLYCQTHVLEKLFYEVNERVKLPQWALNSIARVIDRIDLHIREQLSM
ncbi:hypothetical protein [Cellvibrio mixtus]|uniref:hypothetical protein n=1 Tax=Cellvibrio mixtus TaxID=39650 RepID=UPI000586F0D7|nr:hypothetical protein [Cellvibrio mixtus]